MLAIYVKDGVPSEVPTRQYLYIAHIMWKVSNLCGFVMVSCFKVMTIYTWLNVFFQELDWPTVNVVC